jgi:hypothetical protein
MRGIWRLLSEDQQIGKRLILVQAADGFGQERRARYGSDFIRHGSVLHAQRGNAVRHAVSRRSAKAAGPVLEACVDYRHRLTSH